MRILIVGGGAREDALSWRLASSPSCEALFHAPVFVQVLASIVVVVAAVLSLSAAVAQS